MLPPSLPQNLLNEAYINEGRERYSFKEYFSSVFFCSLSRTNDPFALIIRNHCNRIKLSRHNGAIIPVISRKELIAKGNVYASFWISRKGYLDLGWKR